MKICMVGTGYVGLVSGVCFAETGNDVVCADVDAAKVAMLDRGEIPIFEPGLAKMVERNVKAGRLTFSADPATAIGRSEVIFVAVGTPMRSDGGADLSAVDAVAETVAKHVTRKAVLVLKSTVPVGTNERVQRIVKDAAHPVSVVSNPEFLKEGSAIDDFMKPDRIVIGCRDDDHARDVMQRLYHPVSLSSSRIIFMDPASAELTKYVANTMLAMRISFMNEVASLCEKVGADVHNVRQGVGSDARIGPKFLYAGPGYGGSCVVRAETALVRERGRVRLATLGELYTERASSPDVPPRGAAVVATDDLEVLAWAPGAPRASFEPCAAITKRYVEGELVHLRTKMGRRLRCTPDHPFVVVDRARGTTAVKLASSLTVDDWLPIATSSHADFGEQPDRIDILAELDRMRIAPEKVIVRLGETDRARIDGLGSTGVADALAELSHPRGRDRAYDIVRTGALRLHEARRLDLDLEDATLGTARNGTYVPRFFELDERFWRIVGLYLAEGHCAVDGPRHRLYWSLHPTAEPELVDEVAGYWASHGVKHDVRPGTTTMNVSVSSPILAKLFLRVLRLGSDSYTHRIPDLAWSAPPQHRQALLAALWHGDGSWSYVSGGPSVVLEYGTVSRELADGMLRLLSEQGVVARWKVMRPNKSTRDTSFLTVSGAEQVERAIALVKPARREEVLASLSRQTKRITPTGHKELGDGMRVVRVTSVERRPYVGYVYSLEVPSAQTWVTTGGLVTHNCFPKDVNALAHTASEHGMELELANATARVNMRQKSVLARKLKHFHFDGDLRGRRIAVWGIAFKPRTDDIREAPALQLIDTLLSEGATVAAHDPEAMEHARERYGDRIELCDDPYDAAKGAHALVLVTEWRLYQNPDFARLKELLERPLLVDGRNIWSTYKLAQQGFTYDGIGVRTDL